MIVSELDLDLDKQRRASNGKLVAQYNLNVQMGSPMLYENEIRTI